MPEQINMHLLRVRMYRNKTVDGPAFQIFEVHEVIVCEKKLFQYDFA